MNVTFWRGYSLSGQLRVQEVTRLLPLYFSVTVERKRLRTPDLPQATLHPTYTLTASSLWLHHHTDLWEPNKRLKQLADKWRPRRSSCREGGWGGGHLILALTCERVTWPLLSPCEFTETQWDALPSDGTAQRKTTLSALRKVFFLLSAVFFPLP